LFKLGLSFIAHHLDEFLVVDLAIPIRIDSFQHRVNLLLRHRKVLTLQTLSQLRPADGAATVFVKEGKCSLQVVLLEVGGALQAGRYKLRVVDQSVLIAVDDLHRSLHIAQVNLDLWTVLQSIDQLFNRQLPIAVNIYLSEDLPEQLDLIFGDPGRDQAQRRSFQLH